MEQLKRQKFPVLAATLNFFTFGGGYIYLGKRQAFGMVLLAAFAVMMIEFFVGTFSLMEHVVTGKNLVDTHSVTLTVVAAAVALDGYLIGKDLSR